MPTTRPIRCDNVWGENRCSRPRGHVGPCTMTTTTTLPLRERAPVEAIARELCVGSVHGERGAIPCNCKAIAAALAVERSATD